MVHLLQFLSRSLAVVLCVSLLAPVGHAAGPATPLPSKSQTAKAASGNRATSRPVSARSPQLLDTQEIADLSQRAEEPSREVTGGELSNKHLTYIVIALAAAVFVLVVKLVPRGPRQEDKQTGSG